MRLPFVAYRFIRLPRLFPAFILLLALFAPAGGTAAPQASGRDGARTETTTEAAAPAVGPGAAPPADAAPVSALTAVASAAPSPAPADGAGSPSLNVPEGGQALMPFLDYLLDPTGTLDISQVSAPERAADFHPFRVREPLRQAGTLWLRFRLAPLTSSGPTAASPAQIRLDLGEQVPGNVAVWTRVGSNPPVPAAAEGGLVALAGLSGGGEVFARLDGLPGLWFAPALRTVSESLTTPERRVHPLLLAALTALLLLCLVRSVTERGDGRLWAGVLAGAALVHALWGVPATPRGTVIPFDMPGLLAAGVALMLLPHVGRNIMRTRDTSPRLDVLLLVLALPGAALAVLPLLPGLAWTARLFSLWPLGAAFALVPALVLLARRVPGSGLFSLACLGLVAGGGLALWGMNGTLAAPLWGQAALAGVVFATLLLAAAAPRSVYADLDGDTAESPAGPEPAPLTPDAAPPLDTARVLRLEEILRLPLDTLLREACALDQILERPTENRPLSGDEARQARLRADNLVAATRELASLVGDLPRLTRGRGKPEGKRQVFDLLKLVQSAFADVGDVLEKGDIGLSWYIAPHLGRLYKGDRDRLRFVLAMLLADAARATDRGAVSLRVRRTDTSPNPGHLQFTVADTGSGIPPLRRSSLALAKAWELAADHRGDLFVDSTPHGVEITFGLECVALADDGQTPRPVPPAAVGGRRESGDPNPRLVILAASRSVDRQILAFFLEDQGQDIWEARDTEEAVALYTHTPAALVVFDGRLSEEDIVTAVAAIRVFEGERGLTAAPFLALTLNEEQAERLHQAGCDHSLPLPVVRGEFRAMCLHLASPSGVKPRPSIVPHRIPPTRPHRLETVSAVASGRPETPDFSPLEMRPTEAPARAVAPIPIETAPTVLFPSPAPDAEPTPSGRPSAVRPTASASAGSARPSHPATPVRPTDDTRRATPAAVDGLNLPPSKKRLGWLNRLFKPTPRIAPTPIPDEAVPGASEWVGEPMPVTRPASHIQPNPPAEARGPATSSAPGESGASKTPDIPAASAVLPSPISTGRRETPSPTGQNPAWYSPYGDDPECSVGEPMPIFPARLPAPAASPASPVDEHSTPDATDGHTDIPNQSAVPDQSRKTPESDGMTPVDASLSPVPDGTAEAISPVSAIDSAPPAPADDLPAPAGAETAEPTVSAPAVMPEPENPTSKPADAAPEPAVRPEAEAPDSGATPTPGPQPPVFLRPAVSAAPQRPSPAASRSRSEARSKRRKNRLDDLPFLSLDPNYTPSHADGAEAVPDFSTGRDLVAPAAGARPQPSAVVEESDDIVDLTEAEMVDSPLLQQVPDLLRSLDAAVEHAAGALERRDPWGLINAADRMADRAVAFGLHALSDLALCLKEAGQQRDFDTATQLLPELRAEVERHRRG